SPLRVRGRPPHALTVSFDDELAAVEEDAASEHDVDVEPSHAESADRRTGHRDDLVGLDIDEAPGDGVAVGRGAEQEGRELDEPILAESTGVHRLDDLTRPPQPEVTRDEPAEQG